MTTRTKESSTLLRQQERQDAIVLIDPVTEWKSVVNAAKRRNLRIIAVANTTTTNEKMKSFIPSKLDLQQEGIDHVIPLQKSDFFSCVQEIQWLAKDNNYNIRGVVPLSEVAVESSDTISSCLGLVHHNPLDLLTSRRDKGLMKLAISSAGLKTAKFVRIASKEELQMAITTIPELSTFPIVVKTPQGFSTTGVYICHSLEEALKAVDTLIGEVGPDGRIVQHVLVEEYIDGIEFAINLLACGNKDVVDFIVTDIWKYSKNAQARYSSAELCFPKDDVYQELIQYAKNVATSVGIRYGAAHVELKAKKIIRNEQPSYTRPIVMEVGARLSGGRKASMIQAATDNAYDPFCTLLQSHCGEEISTNNNTIIQPHHFVRHLFLPIEKGGRITKIMFETTTATTVHSSVLLVKVGDIVSPTTDIISCAGFVWLLGDKEPVDKDTDTILSSFRVIVEE